MKSTWIFLALAAAVALVACGSSDPEAKLVEASKKADAAHSAVDEARDAVQAREQDLQNAQQQLADAREALRKAQQEAAEREANVDRSATDAVLFRAVQKRLLEDRDLESVAISATVRSGVVKLTGSVPDGKLRDRAVEIADSTPGVSSVESRIEVAVSAPAEKKPD